MAERGLNTADKALLQLFLRAAPERCCAGRRSAASYDQ
jgi:hypothetical protein